MGTEKKGKPVFLLDLVKMRGALEVDARGSLRVLLDPTPSGKLHIALECCACEEMVEWDTQETWWFCPECEQEFTDTEVERLLVACAKAFVAGTQSEDERPEAGDEPPKQPEMDDGREGDGQWRGRIKSWIRGR